MQFNMQKNCSLASQRKLDPRLSQNPGLLKSALLKSQGLGKATYAPRQLSPFERDELMPTVMAEAMWVPLLES